MKALFLVIAIIGAASCIASSIFHVVDKDITGAMTWLLATCLNMFVAAAIWSSYDH